MSETPIEPRAVNEMVERAVKAIRDPWDRTLHSEKVCRDIVRAVLAEIRTPTDAMMIAGEMRMVPMQPGDGSLPIMVPGLGENGMTIYLRMIDEALKP